MFISRSSDMSYASTTSLIAQWKEKPISFRKQGGTGCFDVAACLLVKSVLWKINFAKTTREFSEFFIFKFDFFILLDNFSHRWLGNARFPCCRSFSCWQGVKMGEGNCVGFESIAKHNCWRCDAFACDRSLKCSVPASENYSGWKECAKFALCFKRNKEEHATDVGWDMGYDMGYGTLLWNQRKNWKP